MDQSPSRRLLLVTFAATIFVSASLLFVVQPMVGKMILPHLGGSSSVWSTCMLFFQAMLVAGYAYAHVIAQQMSPKRQVIVHLSLMGLAVLTSLPFGLREAWLQSQSDPALWLLAALLVSIGLPLFVVSSSAPLFQHWFGFTDHPDADDPYYLYAASNVGSMLALFGYPFFVERFFAVDQQATMWAVGFGLLVALTAGCGAFIFGRDVHRSEAPEAASVEPLTWKRRGWWLLITFIPSSLMLGVTHFLTTDLASVPLLWVLPLGLYLLSFILVFARLPRFGSLYRVVLPPATLLVLAATYTHSLGTPLLVAAHVTLFFLFAMYFHGRLADDRPHTAHLTEFYIWMSVGGALGGLFNGLVAPVIFDWSAEYYLVMAIGLTFIQPLRADEERGGRAAIVGAAVTLVGLLALYFWSVDLLRFDGSGAVFGSFILIATVVSIAVIFPQGQNVGLAVLLLVGATMQGSVTSSATYERSFFASYTLYKDIIDDYRVKIFSHGTTQHGLQSLEEENRGMPIGYYHPHGPVGDVFGVIPHKDVAIAGLGSGGMAPYAREGKQFTFYEIDPVVERIARQDFSYLDLCGDRCNVKIGDARKLLEQADPDSFDIIFMDAYNSDSVPTHLLTRESIKLYLSRLDEEGVILFNVSNRFLNVEGVVGALAEDLGLVAQTRSFLPSMSDEDPDLAYGVTYTVVARQKEDLHDIAEATTWQPAKTAGVVWTDNFTNIVSVLEW